MRCQLAEQLGLQMSSEHRGERVADCRGGVGKLFQMTGPVTAKLLIPGVVLVLGTDSDPVPVDRECCLPAVVEIAMILMILRWCVCVLLLIVCSACSLYQLTELEH